MFYSFRLRGVLVDLKCNRLDGSAAKRAFVLKRAAENLPDQTIVTCKFRNIFIEDLQS
jgi:hypothetical protein